YDPFSARDAVRNAPSEKVVALPPRSPDSVAKPAEPSEPADRWKDISPPGSPVADGLQAIVAQDKSFDPQHFLTGARAAYETIVTAFADGDRRALKNLLSKEVYDGFEAAIREREAQNHQAETRFVSVDTCEIIGAELRAKTAQITLRFVSQLISVTRDRSGKVVDDNPEKVTEVTDVWTFARDVSSRDPNWKLVATEAGH
ncbi:MAG: Tim44/TimA family putative adaptor protein, partial [Rhodoplanes sp.]